MTPALKRLREAASAARNTLMAIAARGGLAQGGEQYPNAFCCIDEAGAIARALLAVAQEEEGGAMDLLRKFAAGSAGRRTGELIGLGYLRVEVTSKGHQALGHVTCPGCGCWPGYHPPSCPSAEGG